MFATSPCYKRIKTFHENTNQIMSSLPEILVTAKSEEAALQFISELVADEAQDGVWRVRNKYYAASVRVTPRAAHRPPPRTAPDAHVLLLAADELAVAAAAPRAAHAPAAAVRLLCADAAALPAALLAWAARDRRHPVALRDPAEGVAAARAALHAHAWPGLRRAPAPAPPAPEAADEQWAAALGALGPAAAAVRGLRGAERLAAAEHVLAAFCRAIGEDVDDL